MESHDISSAHGSEHQGLDPLAAPPPPGRGGGGIMMLAHSHSEIAHRCENILTQVEAAEFQTRRQPNYENDDYTNDYELSQAEGHEDDDDDVDEALRFIDEDPEHHQDHHHRRRRCTSSGFSSSSSSSCCGSSSCLAFWGSVVNLCSATLGAGVLSLPHACAQAGLIMAGVLLTCSAVGTAVSIHLVVRACSYYRLYTYESLSQVLYGKRLRTAVELCIVLFCQGCAVAYLIAVVDILQQANLLLAHSRAYSMILIWACVLLPLSLLRTMAALQLSSAVGVASVGTLVFAAIVHLLGDEENKRHHGGQEHDHHHNATNYTNHTVFAQDNLYFVSDSFLGCINSTDSSSIHWSSMLWPQHGTISILTACPIILFAFSCQVNVCAIYEELPSPSRRTSSHNNNNNNNNKQSFMQQVANTAVTICALLYASISAATLANFGMDHVTPNILNAYHPPLRGIMQVAAAGMVLAVTMAFPLNIFPARVTLDGIWQEKCGGDDNYNDDDDNQHRDRRSCYWCCCCNGWGGTRRQRRTRSQRQHVNDGEPPRSPNDTLTQALLEEPPHEDAESELVRPLEEEQPMPPPTDNILLETTTSGKQPQQQQQPVHHSAEEQQRRPQHNGDNDDTANHFSWFRHVVLTLVLAGSALGIALVAPNISIVFQIIGGTASSGLGFIVPGLLGLRLGRDLNDGTNGQVVCLSWLLLYAGVLIAILTTAVTIYQIVTTTTGT